MRNIEVEAKGNESSGNLIRRFTRAYRRSGISRHVRNTRTYSRAKSKNIQKEQKLKRLQKEKEIDHLIKLGKAPDRRIGKITLEEDDEK